MTPSGMDRSYPCCRHCERCTPKGHYLDCPKCRIDNSPYRTHRPDLLDTPEGAS